MYTCNLILSKSNVTFKAAATECITRLKELKRLVKITFFVDGECEEEFQQKKDLINNLFTVRNVNSFPEVTFVYQKPISSIVAIEYIQYTGKGRIEYKEHNRCRCVEVHTGEELVLFVNAATSEVKSLGFQAHDVFERVEKLLTKYGIGMDSVVRQWNYIPGILDSKDGFQNYQTFNDIRTYYYNKKEWKKGYPAATGIGVNGSRLTMDFVATKGCEVNAIINPNQIDAYEYSNRVLEKSIDLKSTPKFERAKFVKGKGDGLMFVSGTAAIIGEESSSVKNVEQQTFLTLNHIETLLLSEHLNTVLDKDTVFIQSMRVYIKHPDDYCIVQKLCAKRFPEASILYLVSDVCRNELLVEIEAFGITC